MEKLFIPKKLKVGYQERNDTYTGRLAYVIYIDEKGVLRKEKSWRGWIKDKPYEDYVRDEKGQLVRGKNGQWKREMKPGLPIDDFDNVPMEGFVLNRDGGGGRGWDARNAFIRIYDPRNFEFEISVENLLFIFRYCGLVPGKGLTGEFVYAWQGTELVLLPVSCQEYISSSEFTDLKDLSLKKEDLHEGWTYYTKNQERVVYLGHMNSFVNDYGVMGITKGHLFFFPDKEQKEYFYVNNNYKQVERPIVKILKIADLAKIMDQNVYPDYATVFENCQDKGILFGPNTKFSLSDNKPKIEVSRYDDWVAGQFWKVNDKGIYCGYIVKTEKIVSGRDSYYSTSYIKLKHCELYKFAEMTFDELNPQFKFLASRSKASKDYTKKEIEDMDWKKLYVKIPSVNNEQELFLKK